jgi:hypothetical protein
VTTTAEIERLVHYMPILVRDGGVSEWERKFAASIIHRSRRTSFVPTDKQIGVMKRMVDAFQDRQADELVESDPANPKTYAHGAR